MSKKPIELSRRKILAGVGAAGVASVGAGLGTSAYFNDTESFTGNELVAGELDMKVAYSAHYSDWSDDEGDGVNVSMWDGASGPTGGEANLSPGNTGLPLNDSWQIEVDDPDQFLDNTQYTEVGDASCDDGTDSGDLEQPVINIEDVKPGDFGEVTFDFNLCDNPGYVWLQGELQSCSENGVTEPEAEDEDENEDEPRPPEGEEPQAESLWPALAAGGIPASSSLFDSEKRAQVAEKVKGIAETDAVSRKDVLKAAGAGAAGAAGVGALAGTAAASPGDVLGTVSLPDNNDPNEFECSVAGTWDGTYYTTIEATGSCSSDVMQIYEPPASASGTATKVAEKDIVDGSGGSVPVSAIEWDATRGKYWGAYAGTTYLIDGGDPTDGTDDAVVEDSFDSSDAGGFATVDGIAIDDNDTLWYSPDVDTEVARYDLSSGSRGDLLDIIEPKNSNGNVAGSISGVAVGAPMNGRETLYVGQNVNEDNGNILRVYADDGEYIDDFATGTDFRVEDITCAPALYDSEVLLVKDSYVGEYKAFEVEDGTCPLSGGGGEQPDTECADVELLDAVQAAAWVDDGDNYQDGDEEPAISGSLRTVLDTLSTDFGLELAGDIPAEEGGGTGRNCFSGGTEHSVAFAWWVPTSVGNEIQTDSVSFDLGFYTEQCRHNDGSGQPPEGDGDT